MPYVLTVDQMSSRADTDRIPDGLRAVSAMPTLLGFERTVGDELQGLLDDPESVVDAILTIMRDGRWHVGLGIGRVELPLPASVRAARGPALLAAREAVEAAKDRPEHLAVRAPGADEEATDLEVLLRLVATLRARRTREGWAAVDLIAGGLTQSAAAERLAVSRQAVGQRLQAAHWALESDTRPTAVRLLRRTHGAATDRA